MHKVLISGIIGNALEWYDFALYAHFSIIIGKFFFPSYDPFMATISTWGVFAAGFLMRPLGAIVFGYIGDKYGRRASLTASIVLMALPTGCIGLLPEYNSIGIFAPIILTIIRLCQGLSLGGEFSGAISFVVEHAPKDKKAFAGSSAMFSMCLGILFGSFVSFLLTMFYTETQIEEYAWRYPFLLGFLIGFIGIYIRTSLHESKEYLDSQKLLKKHRVKNPNEQSPLANVFTNFRTELLIAICIYLTVTVPFYFSIFFLKEYLFKYEHIAYGTARSLSTMVVVVATVLLPIFGYISDKVGCIKVAKYSAIGYILFTFPAFILIKLGFVIPGIMIFAVLVGIYMAPIPIMLVDLFPVEVRYTAVAVSYNISAAVFGGTTPIVFSYILQNIKVWELLPLYITTFAIISLIAIMKYPRKH